MTEGGWTADSDASMVAGQLCRIIGIASPDRVLVELRQGGEGHLDIPAIGELPVGTVLYGHDGRWEQIAHDLWPGGDLVGTVESSSDAAVVIRVGAQSLQAFAPDPDLPLTPGQLVSVGPDGLPLAVLSTDKGDDRSRREDAFDPADLIVRKESLTTTLDDVGGSTVLKRKARDLVNVALDPRHPLREMKVNPIKGILFSGPPGTGKTHLARALAKEADATFYLVSGPAIVDQWLGQTERRLRDVFEHAVANKPSIVFFDEIDSLYTSRGNETHEATNRLVGQFLSILDGVIPLDQVLVIATTNLSSVMDDALLRPGRLGHRLTFTLPSMADRELILRASAREMERSEEPDWPSLAGATEGWSGAELAAIWTEAGVAAALDGRLQICREDVIYGLSEVATERETRRAQR